MQKKSRDKQYFNYDLRALAAKITLETALVKKLAHDGIVKRKAIIRS